MPPGARTPAAENPRATGSGEAAATRAPYLLERFERSVPSILATLGLDTSVIFLDGEFVSGAAAAISVWDHGLLYGDGVFEGIRAYEGRVFKLDDHLDRLYASAAAIGLTIPLAKEEFAEALCLTFEANGLDSGHARPVVTRGVGLSGVDPRRAVRPSVMIQAVESPAAPPTGAIRMCVATVRRRSSQSIDSRIKCLNYMDSVLARLEANAAGMDDALLLDLDGHVAEASAANVFIVADSVVATPQTTSALPGITRRTVIRHLHDLGMDVVERDLTVEEILAADEMFLTGTAVEIRPVGQVDGHPIGHGGDGEVTAHITAWYGDHVRTSNSHHILGGSSRTSGPRSRVPAELTRQ
jgi:branched-chain amino acid aminotransferase